MVAQTKLAISSLSGTPGEPQALFQSKIDEQSSNADF